MHRDWNRLVALAGLCFGLVTASPVLAAWGSFNYGSGTVDMYTPKTPAASPALVVVIHYCGGSAGSTHGWMDSAADKYGPTSSLRKRAGSVSTPPLGAVASGQRSLPWSMR
jgi:hypothetical protein